MTQHIGVFVTGGIAAYKVPGIVRDLIKAGHEVRVAMTPSAAAFVTPTTLATVSKAQVLTDADAEQNPEHVAHVALAHWMDLAVVVPATANTLAKLAFGLADNVVTTTLLAFNGPKLLVPAMNDQMWQNPQTQQNIAHLKALGFRVLQPATGFLAEGYAAVGRMPEPSVIAAFIATYQPAAFLAGRTVLVTAGGTRERLDPVRYLTNDSSGKMGTALANVAAAAGARVTLITTATQPVLPDVTVVKVASAAQMTQAVLAAFAESDVAIMAAAVADYRPVSAADLKLKKTGTAGLSLELTQTQDILKTLGTTKTHQLVVGFAAETDHLLANAQQKLAAKHADLLVANRVGPGIGFNQDVNQVTLLAPSREPEAVPAASKVAVAAAILHRIEAAL
ncbi:bifunctional phosphopantothenoylcysteine decarboxylase/phosphopantothenate--cysteine ligase CoaBC [Lacticaseibacillus parakribbianus]|uniref:bifunctional phosphopantothenoylcysteine decarboxylase/phosphopantothenate--cysteine ligase CoaBC n=1 Tax=Lacticaseibacillus parakribbianus TaxID=2970927 RepID=UPI0021CB98A2|nr:bifunctional phosphopantothenoylcysteine decarboxylase/phosphopantothenate--cysteine ligase CoaBC [Lacticaseibacillus parakribbianus]